MASDPSNLDKRDISMEALEDFFNILEYDPAIDELGFLPSASLEGLAADSHSLLKQEERLKVTSQNKSSSEALPANSLAEAIEKIKLPVYNQKIFWYGDHRIAIALESVGSLYAAASRHFLPLAKAASEAEIVKKVEVTAAANERDISKVSVSGLPSSLPAEQGESKLIMNLTGALVLLNANHATAWNMRKRIFGQQNDFSSEVWLRKELQLCRLVISHNSKSPDTWAHRRWVLKTLAKIYEWNSDVVQSLLESESRFVQQCAERTPMNYRAWSHRCWAAQHMNLEKVENELERSKAWVRKFVEDNCGLHYRRFLLRQIFELRKSSGLCKEKTETLTRSAGLRGEGEMGNADWMENHVVGVQTGTLLQDEAAWIKNLLEIYPGREALWIHRRFLFFFWCCHVASRQQLLKDFLESTEGKATSVGSERGESAGSRESVEGVAGGGREEGVAHVDSRERGSGEEGEQLYLGLDLGQEVILAEAYSKDCAGEGRGREGVQQRSHASTYHTWILWLVKQISDEGQVQDADKEKVEDRTEKWERDARERWAAEWLRVTRRSKELTPWHDALWGNLPFEVQK